MKEKYFRMPTTVNLPIFKQKEKKYFFWKNTTVEFLNHWIVARYEGIYNLSFYNIGLRKHYKRPFSYRII